MCLMFQSVSDFIVLWCFFYLHLHVQSLYWDVHLHWTTTHLNMCVCCDRLLSAVEQSGGWGCWRWVEASLRGSWARRVLVILGSVLSAGHNHMVIQDGLNNKSEPSSAAGWCWVSRGGPHWCGPQIFKPSLPQISSGGLLSFLKSTISSLVLAVLGVWLLSFMACCPQTSRWRCLHKRPHSYGWTGCGDGAADTPPVVPMAEAQNQAGSPWLHWPGIECQPIDDDLNVVQHKPASGSR